MNGTERHVLSPIMVADDDAATRALLTKFLEKTGLRNPVLIARDGREAIESLQHALKESIVPALLLLDVHMPKVSGLDVLRWFENERKLARTNVVVLTGSADAADIDAAYELGAVSYLVKPVGFSALTDVVKTLGAPWVLLPRDSDEDA